VNKQVCVEVPLGITTQALIDEHAGGVWKGRKAKAAVPGGISMGLLSADELDTPLDFESLRKPGCLGLGTAAVTVIDDQTSMVDYLYNTSRFFAHESCGQCTPCRELIDVHAQGVWKGRKAKAAVPGGISMGLLSAEELDTPLDFESLRKPGCLGLGTAAVTVIDDHTSIVDYLYNTARFFAHESCGQCTPCREGTGWMYKTIKRIRSGGGRIEDLDILLQMANNLGIIPGTTICGLADGAAWPIKNGITKFRAEFEDYIRTHQDPAHAVTRLQETIAHGLPAEATHLALPILPGPGPNKV
jgi:NADH:ubiquinone oxidoreductase subunit F (NADH-binding)